MFKLESKWIIKVLSKFEKIADIADVGCSTQEYRTKTQPYIKNIYRYLESRNTRITKIDLDKRTDADIYLDITHKLPKNIIGKFNVVLATSLIEHIQKDKVNMLVGNLSKMLTEKGMLICTAPNNLPIHNRPFDNGLRPNCKEMVALLKDYFDCIQCETWTDEHYREPYISQPNLAELPKVTGGIFIKK